MPFIKAKKHRQYAQSHNGIIPFVALSLYGITRNLTAIFVGFTVAWLCGDFVLS